MYGKTYNCFAIHYSCTYMYVRIIKGLPSAINALPRSSTPAVFNSTSQSIWKFDSLLRTAVSKYVAS